MPPLHAWNIQLPIACFSTCNTDFTPKTRAVAEGHMHIPQYGVGEISQLNNTTRQKKTKQRQPALACRGIFSSQGTVTLFDWISRHEIWLSKLKLSLKVIR